MAVDWGAERRRARAGQDAVLGKVDAAFSGMVRATLERVRPLVLAGGRPDPRGAFAATAWWAGEAGEWVDSHLSAVAWAALDDADVNVIPESEQLINDYLDSAKNRLVGVPDRVFDLLREIVREGVQAGDANDEMAERVEKLFANEGVEVWGGRIMTIVRTEAIAAQNMGQYASFLSIAALDPSTEWEKAWLATDDKRTRPTHNRADGQRRPLRAMFSVGDARLRVPGDPRGPAEEVINCRCAPLLVEKGDEIDMSDRQMKED